MVGIQLNKYRETGLICIKNMCMNSQGRLDGHIRKVRALQLFRAKIKEVKSIMEVRVFIPWVSTQTITHKARDCVKHRPTPIPSCQHYECPDTRGSPRTMHIIGSLRREVLDKIKNSSRINTQNINKWRIFLFLRKFEHGPFVSCLPEDNVPNFIA